MEIVINPVATRVWRSPSSLQIGLGANKVILENLQPRHEALIEALFSGLATSQVGDYGRHLKMRTSETQALVSALKPVLLSRPDRVRQTDSTGQTLETELAASAISSAASLDTDNPTYQMAKGEMNQASLSLNARGETVWALRRNSAIFIGNLDRTGLAIVEALASAGVGAIVSGDLNESRLANTSEMLDKLPQRPTLLTLPQLTEAQLSRLDLAILLGQQIIEPQKFAAWMNRGTAQLAAIFASAAEGLETFVSHVIVASETPCWVCLELNRCSLDEAWPHIASQLVGREQAFDSASARLLVAGQVAEKALAHIDWRNGFGTLTPNPRWPFSLDCSCRLGAAKT